MLFRSCIGLASVCDTVYDCAYEEDERFCTALVNSSHLAITGAGDPWPQSSGTLLLKQGGAWSPICLTQMSYAMAGTICSYMGYNVKVGLGRRQGRPHPCHAELQPGGARSVWGHGADSCDGQSGVLQECGDRVRQ